MITLADSGDTIELKQTQDKEGNRFIELYVDCGSPDDCISVWLTHDETRALSEWLLNIVSDETIRKVVL
jgi:hypothetical protein